MTEMTTYPWGQLSWADLMTTDVEGAKRFYTGLFGWDLRDTPIPMGGYYTQFYLRGRSICGAGEMNADLRKQGVPPAWSVYVNIEDCERTCARATEAGGKVLMPPMEVMDEGRMCMIADPTGAVLGGWQPKKHKGAGLYNEHGALCWFELLSRDAPAAKRFYTSVFGWAYKEGGDDKHPYSEIRVGDTRHFAGIMPMPPGMDGVPSHWMPYFDVVEIQAAVKKVRELGGKVMREPQLIPEVGSFAVVADPQGAAFELLEYRGKR